MSVKRKSKLRLRREFCHFSGRGIVAGTAHAVFDLQGAQRTGYRSPIPDGSACRGAHDFRPPISLQLNQAAARCRRYCLGPGNHIQFGEDTFHVAFYRSLADE